jgi:hypothetical protein
VSTTPTKADVDAAWLALQPRFAEFSRTGEAFANTRETWMADLQMARKFRYSEAAPALLAVLATSGTALSAAHAAYKQAVADYSIAEHDYDVLRLRYELAQPKGDT